MKIPNIALASLLFDISSAATSAFVSAFLQDLIKSNYLTPKMADLTCDPKKIWRTRVWSKKIIIEVPIKRKICRLKKRPYTNFDLRFSY